MHLSNPYLPSLGRERLSHVFSHFRWARWRKLLAPTPCADSWRGWNCKFMILVPASSLQIGSFTSLHFCEQQKQSIFLFLLLNAGKQRNGHLIFALIFKQKSVDGFVQRRGIFFAHQQNEWEKVPQAPYQWTAKANFAVKGPTLKTFVSP